jgi:multiple sugar transport system permease protein
VNALLWMLALVTMVVAIAQTLAVAVAGWSRKDGLHVGLGGFLSVALFLTVLDGKWWVTLLLSIVVGALAVWRLRALTRNAVHASQIRTLSGTHLALLAGSFLFLLPFAWLLSTSLKPDDEQAVFPPIWIPTQQRPVPMTLGDDGKPGKLSKLGQREVVELADLPSGAVKVKDAASGQVFEAPRSELVKQRSISPRWANYVEALAYLPPDTHYGLTFLLNTLTLTSLTVIGTVLASALVAFSFSRLHWPGRDALFGLLLATMMIPGAITLMPQFLIFRSLGWIDTLRPLFVPAFFGSAFNIFMLRQFFLSIPTELEDAAKIDGCGPFGVWWRVMLPQVKPALAAIAIMATLAAWNNFQGPLIYLSSPEKMPLAYGLQLYQTQHANEPGLLMAASTLVVLPILVLFFFTQRYFIEGVSLTGLGGR